ncbi:MAG: hypothetical protein E7773_14560 [Sphingomonas sp.]|uniref:hypothetical protein n=1 Tax=Sphingomonas sp. TaxID=28214 RepID=UPI0012193E6A|nr:hypothetical protein [Sphingomonas sp.]THD34601.1 MAG: hypothetical protein E7773_14560 [Sphingomonas sp.]
MSIRGRAWTALLLPPVSWFVFEQGLSTLLHADCTQWGIGLAWGIVSLTLCGVAFRIAWPLRQPREGLADIWLARLALVTAGLFALAIAFQTLAISMVPACLR